MTPALTLTFISRLSSIEKLTLYVITTIVAILILDWILRNIKKKRSLKMLKDYLDVKNNKWDTVVDLLTNPDTIQEHDIKAHLRIDISKFDHRYRDLLYHDIVKTHQDHQINDTNLKLFVKVLYNKI